jgi:amyloid beta precursor protein binding protein 1
LIATPHVTPSGGEELLSAIAELAPGVETKKRVVKAAAEVVCAEGGELHNVSAVVGGMAAQELIKVITCQYIPIDNTCVFDGISSRCQVLRL